MRISKLPAAASIGLGIVVAGCIFKPPIDPNPTPVEVYSINHNHPDSLIKDLQISYRRKDIDAYARLLGREYIFHFLPADAGEIPDGEWNKDEDSTGTYGLFHSTDVFDIRIALETSAPVEALLRGETVQRVDVTYTDLQVDIDGGNTTLQVNGDRQLFYFQRGEEADGEDTTQYYFVDWEDQGSGDRKPSPERARELSRRIAQGGKVPVTLSEMRALLGAPE